MNAAKVKPNRVTYTTTVRLETSDNGSAHGSIRNSHYQTTTTAQPMTGTAIVTIS